MSTNIEWARNPDGSKGETWPVCTGCTSVSEGCRFCYAARMAATRLKHHPRYEGLATIENGKARWTGKVNLNHDVLEQPLHWRKPRMVFIASMGDLFHPDVSFMFVSSVWRIMASCQKHTFQILTKRPKRMLEFLNTCWRDWVYTPKVAPVDYCNKVILPNVWLGVSVENQATADERIQWLLRTPAAVRFVSVEPYLSAVDLTPWLPGYIYKAHGEWIMNTTTGRNLPPLDWVICGGESGPGARPMHPDWARSLRGQCQAAGTPFFFKQWGEYLGIDYLNRPAGEAWGGPPVWFRADGLSEIIGRKPDIDFGDGHGAIRIGKKRAGRLLDGRIWDEMPKGELR